MSSQEYIELHEALLQALRAMLKSDSTDEHLHRIVQQMKTECRPWVSLESLAHAEKHLVRETLERAIQIQHHLAGDSILYRRLIFGFLGVLGLTAVGFVLVLCLQANIELAHPGSVTSSLHALAYRTWYRLSRIDPLEWIAVAVGFTALFGFWALRATREY